MDEFVQVYARGRRKEDQGSTQGNRHSKVLIVEKKSMKKKEKELSKRKGNPRVGSEKPRKENTSRSDNSQ